MYILENQFIRSRDYFVTVAGCGGTGGFVAEGLCRLLPHDTDLLLVDPDRVEERNLVRQNFYRNDLGMPKCEALAHRLSAKFDRAIAYSPLPVSRVKVRHNMIIGCVDNGLARADIARIADKRQTPWDEGLHGWWVDSGNGENYGQVLIGNCLTIDSCAFHFENQRCAWLPVPTIQRPELLKQIRRTPSCAEAVARDEQSPVINQAMAAIVLEVVRRIINGTCPWMQLYLDMETGALTPVYATPEAVAQITKISARKLIYYETKKKGGKS